MGILIYDIIAHQYTLFNSLAPGKFQWNFRHVIFKQILVIDGWGIACEIAQIWMSLVFTDDQSTLVQVMAWCRQATSHYLNQCWPRSLSPYGVIRPQWVKALPPASSSREPWDASRRLNIQVLCSLELIQFGSMYSLAWWSQQAKLPVRHVESSYKLILPVVNAPT